MIPVITIDGPGGTGKGSLSLRLKRTLGWFMLDSGALYRALAFSVLERDVSSQDEKRTPRSSSVNKRRISG